MKESSERMQEERQKGEREMQHLMDTSIKDGMVRHTWVFTKDGTLDAYFVSCTITNVTVRIEQPLNLTNSLMPPDKRLSYKLYTLPLGELSVSDQQLVSHLNAIKDFPGVAEPSELHTWVFKKGGTLVGYFDSCTETNVKVKAAMEQQHYRAYTFPMAELSDEDQQLVQRLKTEASNK
jgi:hypothetical protein